MVAWIREPLIDSRMRRGSQSEVSWNQGQGRRARAGSGAAVAARGRPETQAMAQRADQVIQLVKQLRDSFHFWWWPCAQRRPVPGGGSTGSSPFSLRQAVRTLSAHDL